MSKPGQHQQFHIHPYRKEVDAATLKYARATADGKGDAHLTRTGRIEKRLEELREKRKKEH